AGAVFAGFARAGIERHLVAGYVQHARVVAENGLRAVAVVDVEIDDGDTVETVRTERVRGGGRDTVEQAEAHRFVAGRVVSGRTHRAERAAGFAGEHGVGCGTCGAGG